MRHSLRAFVILVLLVGAFESRVFAAGEDPASARAAAQAARAILERNTSARPPTYAIETGRSVRIEASIAYAASAPRMSPTEWIVVCPVPPELPWQRNVQVEATPAASTVRETGGLERPMLQWRIPNSDPAKRVTALGVQFKMELAPRRLIALADSKPQTRPATDSSSAAPSLSLAELRAFTSPSSWADFEMPAFQTWLAEKSLRPQEKETDVEFARRVFLFIKENATFEFKPALDRRSTVVAKSLKSDCGGLTALFVSVLRANGIPARQLVGRWAITAKNDEKLEGQDWQQEHIKTEFFAGGIGWVPVDMSVAIAYDKDRSSLKHFGRDDGDFVAFHIDLDLHVDTVHFGRQTMPLMQEPNFWVKGSGQMQGSNARFDWQVISHRSRR